jgi:hypothetical protein
MSLWLLILIIPAGINFVAAFGFLVLYVVEPLRKPLPWHTEIGAA